MSKVFTENRKARHDYQILETIEAGLELRGGEVKSIRHSEANLKGSFVDFRNGQAWLQKAYIARYRKDQDASIDPYRLRRILLHKREVRKLESQASEKGLTVIPLKLYETRGLIKLSIALGKGKKNYDKRADLKARDLERELSRE